MLWLVLYVSVFLANLLVGMRDIYKGNTTGLAAFTWFVIGTMVAVVIAKGL